MKSYPINETGEATMTTTPTTRVPSKPEELLPDDMLKRFDQRAPDYDRANQFFEADWAELQQVGYLLGAVPTEFGGAGLGLSQVSQLQRRLAYHAPATALAVNMHLYWTGLAADLYRQGDESCRWVLERAADGAIFAAGHGEPGVDLPLLLSTTKATRVDGGWRINGRKIFGSLSPVWTYLGFHAMDASDPANPVIVHGFLPRNAPDYRIVDTWDTLGMRATQSQDTIFDNTFVPDALVPLVCPAGFAGAGPFQLSIFAWGLLGFASVYLGAAQRAFHIALDAANQRTSIALTRPMAYHPEVQHQVAKMRMALDACEALLDTTARDWTEGVAHADWPVRLVGTRYTVITKAFEVVDRAMEVAGGAAAFRRNRLEQLFRDVRMGRFHPGNTFLAHELIGKLCLGINPDDPQRWG
jgi:alkylation response protein AidB-like acyl-CoA dehydrogenase